MLGSAGGGIAEDSEDLCSTPASAQTVGSKESSRKSSLGDSASTSVESSKEDMLANAKAGSPVAQTEKKKYSR